MPIREKGYYNWEGELKASYVKWLPIFLTGIKGVYKKRFSKLVISFFLSYSFIFLFLVFLSSHPAGNFLKKAIEVIQTDKMLFYYYYTYESFLLFFMVIMSIFAGAELISGDLKFKSFTLYLSRPLSRLDYVKGKFSIVLFYLLSLTLGPAILLIIFKMILTGSFSVSIRVFLGVIIFPILISLFLASLSIMLSSLSANARLVKVIIFVFYVMSNAIARMFYDIFKSRSFLYISISENADRFGEFVFGTRRGGFYTEGLISGCILLGLTLIFFAILAIRIKRVEV
jgi:ABC-type transport system involved in multi-copper enzyme maturation permease subunit